MAIYDPFYASSPSTLRRTQRRDTHVRSRRPDELWSVIPAGGSGTRLWPLSRSGQPKFLLPLVNPRRSLIQETVDRLQSVSNRKNIIIVCGPAHASPITRQLPELATNQIVVEPSPKGSGPAIALAAAIISNRDPNAVMGSFAADHDVRSPIAFTTAIRDARAAAEEGWLVTIGIRPTRPETGYGYIEKDPVILLTTPMSAVHKAARFVEKPDLGHATAYMESGRFLWNASMFIWRVDVFMSELRRYLPDVAHGVEVIADAWGYRSAG